MTCREKLMDEEPVLVSPGGMVYGCPSDHGYLPNPDYCVWPSKYPNKCMECWDREIPENNEIKKENEEMKETTCPNYTPREEAPRTRTVGEIEEEMQRLREELEEAKKREALLKIAAKFKTVVDRYVEVGFSREEAITIVLAMVTD